MQHLVKVGGHNVLASGNVISYEDSVVEIGFDVEGPKLSLVFSFHDDESGQPKIEARVNDGNRLELQLFNFNSSIDQGNTNPITIGEVGGKKLTLNFRVRRLSDVKSRTLEYSIYIEL